MATEASIKVEIPEGTKMRPLHRNALARVPMTVEAIEAIYGMTVALPCHSMRKVCESHERLRMETEGVGQLTADMEETRIEIASVLAKLDAMSEEGWCGGMFDGCRNQLRALLPPGSEVRPVRYWKNETGERGEGA
jgi:N-formylglutamate amidohydrolase